MIRSIIAAALLAMFATQAEAKYQARQIEFDRHNPSQAFGARAEAVQIRQQRRHHAARSHKRIAVGALDRPRSRSKISARHQEHSPGRTAIKITTQIMPHPKGCPRTAFCGCGTALHIFRKNIRELWLARNWYRFPPAGPAPGMVAVRRHHVFAILKVLDRRRVLAYDPNSGQHKTRIHIRSLVGYSVRNPQKSRYASI